MKASTRLSSVFFQLTPTRTRCDLIIVANDKKERIASGLLNPFLAHLKTAQDQIARGGYSILLEPGTDIDSAWFTKAIVERFVRFVSTPDILERVYTIETEMLQIEEAIAMQRRSTIGECIVKDNQGKPLGGSKANKSLMDATEEKAIVLYEPGELLPEITGPCLLEGDSKVHLLKVLGSRKTMLEKEQGMAFACAAAAGFDIDDIAPLVSFAMCFGASRLMEACSRFMDLWKIKHETGALLNVEASETLSSTSDFSKMNAHAVILSSTQEKHNESNHELASENNEKSGSACNAAGNAAPNSQQECFQGQLPHIVFPPWPMHVSPGAQPIFQACPVQGLRYYQICTGCRPFFQQPHHPIENFPTNPDHPPGHKVQSVDGLEGNTTSEMGECDCTRSLDDVDREVSCTQKPRKKDGGFNKKQLGMVVIQNINYISSEEKNLDSESNSGSNSDNDTAGENFEADDHDVIHQNGNRSLRSNRNPLKSEDELNFGMSEAFNFKTDADDGHWQEFQNCLMRVRNEDARAGNEDMFATKKDFIMKRQLNTVGSELVALRAQDKCQMQDIRMNDIHLIWGSTSFRPRESGDDALFSKKDHDFWGSIDQTDIQLAEINGGKTLSRTTDLEFTIGNQQSPATFRNSSYPIAVNGFEGATNNTDTESADGMADETFIVPFRSMSIDQDGQTDRTVTYVDSENLLSQKKLDPKGDRNQIYYEPDDLSLTQERVREKMSVGYDRALDYETQGCAGESQEKGEKDATEARERLKKSDKNRRSKGTSDTVKQRTGGSFMKEKPLKMTPSEDAQLRAERLRSYKADLQKFKKEKEEEEVKRLEALKKEWQKRIAARGSSISRIPSGLSPQTRQFPIKLSPAAGRGSKFSDSGPGPSSPLQRSKIRTSLGLYELPKASKASKLSEASLMTGNRLTKSLSSTFEMKRESNGGTPDSKSSMAHIQRISEPRKVPTHSIISMKAQSAEAVSKLKLSEGPLRSQGSAIINLDRGKTATLPDPKIHVSAGENILAFKYQKVNGRKQSTFCENSELNMSNCNTEPLIDADDKSVVEKNVVTLECEKPSLSNFCSYERKSGVCDQMYDDDDKGEENDRASDLAPIRAPPSLMKGVARDPVICQSPKQSDSNEVLTACSEKHPPNFANDGTAEKSYPVPPAHVVVEDPYSGQSESVDAPQVSSELKSRVEENVRSHIANEKTLKIDKYSVTSGRTLASKSSKRLMRFLMFGKKNDTSSSVKQSLESDRTISDGTELNDNASYTASTREVCPLKNLISQDETSTAGSAAQKIPCRFSLLSHFRTRQVKRNKHHRLKILR